LLPTSVLLDFNTSQLLIDTPTTIVTVLLVASLQNTQTRNEQAIPAQAERDRRRVGGPDGTTR
jgi:low affinity Fe/Cu permease